MWNNKVTILGGGRVPNHRVLICDRGRFSVRDVLMKRLLSRC